MISRYSDLYPAESSQPQITMVTIKSIPGSTDYYVTDFFQSLMLKRLTSIRQQLHFIDVYFLTRQVQNFNKVEILIGFITIKLL